MVRRAIVYEKSYIFYLTQGKWRNMYEKSYRIYHLGFISTFVYEKSYRLFRRSAQAETGKKGVYDRQAQQA